MFTLMISQTATQQWIWRYREHTSCIVCVTFAC